MHRLEVVVRVRPDRVEALGEMVGDRAMASATPTGEHDPDGWTRLRLRMEWPNDAHRQLLRLGSDLEVIEPEELRVRMADAARATPPPLRRERLIRSRPLIRPATWRGHRLPSISHHGVLMRSFERFLGTFAVLSAYSALRRAWILAIRSGSGGNRAPVAR